MLALQNSRHFRWRFSKGTSCLRAWTHTYSDDGLGNDWYFHFYALALCDCVLICHRQRGACGSVVACSDDGRYAGKDYGKRLRSFGTFNSEPILPRAPKRVSHPSEVSSPTRYRSADARHHTNDLVYRQRFVRQTQRVQTAVQHTSGEQKQMSHLLKATELTPEATVKIFSAYWDFSALRPRNR
jgi:hypothetical protein